MPRYFVDIHCKGTLDDSGLEIEELKEVPPSRVRRFFSWFWGTDIKVKVFILIVLGIIAYGSNCAYQAGDIREGYRCLKPISDRIIEVVQGIITG